MSAFYLLAVWDVWVATFAAAALNFAVGAYALRLGHESRRTSRDRWRRRGPRAPAPRRACRIVYLAAALSGLTALGAQVVWTRLLTLLFGATVYAFAIILAVFLAGLGIGSALAACLLRRGVNAVRGLAWTPARSRARAAARGLSAGRGAAVRVAAGDARRSRAARAARAARRRS